MDNSKPGSGNPVDRSRIDGCRVLIAEDDQVGLLLAIESPRRLGCLVEGVSDGGAAADVLPDATSTWRSWTCACR